MCFNTFLGLVICLECSCGIGNKSIASHIQEVHWDAKIRLDHAKLNQTLADLEVKEEFDLADLPVSCPQIEGLHLTPEAYICPHCQRIRGHLASIKEHHLQDHKSLPTPSSWKKIAAQQIHHKNRTPYFQVIPKAPAAEADAGTQHFIFLQKERERTVADYDMSKINPRQVSTWLNATKWHVLVSPYDHQHLLSLVKMPERTEATLEILAKAVLTYTKRADLAMDTLSNLALRIINSPEPPYVP